VAVDSSTVKLFADFAALGKHLYEAGSFKIRDRLRHPKPGGCVEPSELDSAFAGLLNADILLAKAWVKAKSNTTARPVLVRS